MRIAEKYGVDFRAQHAVKITDILGWFEYVAKHSARGAVHYQRDKTLPKGWHKSGRMWGKSGNWITEKVDYNVSEKIFHDVRRMANRLLIAKARDKCLRTACYVGSNEEKHYRQNVRRLVYLRTRLQKPAKVSRRLPLSDWGITDALKRYILTRYQEV